MKNKKKNNKNKNYKKNINNKEIITIEKKEINQEELKKKRKKFTIYFIIWICILGSSFIKKTLQNDTFYTIKIGELIMNNGIDMMDHFSFHSNLAYTYPHWLYDVFIYLIYNTFGFTGIHISSIIFFLLILIIVFKTNRTITDNYFVSAFATFICALALSGFATARAQLVSFLVFALEIYFIEMFLKKEKKKYLIELLLLSLILCNIHVAVWPFYFIIYLPYLAEYLISLICEKIKIKKETKFTLFLKKKFILEKNQNIKYLFLIMILSIFTGLITPIGDTPYTYLIKTMMGNSQKYISEHQMLSWINSPFTIIIAAETIILALVSKVKLRDLFMISGLVLMSIISTRHLSLLALIGTICYAREFSMFFENFNFNVDNIIISFFNKKIVAITSFIIVIAFSTFLLNLNLKKEFITKELYPTEAVKYIKENIDIKNMRLFNEYNFGSYLILNDIPVFIDSRADLYTKQFSGFNYDIFDDFYYLLTNYEKTFQFYNITHVLIYKEITKEFNQMLSLDNNYKLLYEDDNFVLYERLENDSKITITYN